MATAPTTHAMANIALCQAVYWAEGVPAETRLFGIGRILGFEQPATAETTDQTNAETATQPQAEGAKRIRQKNAGTNARGTATATGGQRQARKGSRRGELLNLIRDGNGLSRGDILELMQLKGDKSGEMSVSNALTALTSKKQVRRENGKYLPAIETVPQGTLTEQAAAAA